MSEFDPLKEGGNLIFKMESKFVSDMHGGTVIFEFHPTTKIVLMVDMSGKFLNKEHIVGQGIKDIEHAKTIVQTFKVAYAKGYLEGRHDAPYFTVNAKRKNFDQAEEVLKGSSPVDPKKWRAAGEG